MISMLMRCRILRECRDRDIGHAANHRGQPLSRRRCWRFPPDRRRTKRSTGQRGHPVRAVPAVIAGAGSSPAGGSERHRLRCNRRLTHVELDHSVLAQRDRPRILGPRLAIDERRDLAGGGPDLVGAQRLAPLVEEVAEGVDPRARRLDVDDAVGGVRVKPVVALLSAVEQTLRRLLRHRADQADRRRELPWLPVYVDLKMGVDVVGELLDRSALDSVDGRAGGGRRGRRKPWSLLDRDIFGADRAACTRRGAGHRTLRGAAGRGALVRAARRGRRRTAAGCVRAGAGGTAATARAERQRAREQEGDRHGAGAHRCETVPGCGSAGADNLPGVMSDATAPAGLPMTTAIELPGMTIRENLGVIFGLVVRSMGFTGGVAASFKGLRRGEITQYTALLGDSRRHAIDRMVDNARLLDADAIVAARFDSSEIGQQFTEIVAYGTAVKVDRVG